MVAQAVAAIALGLLGASGVVKLVDPEPTTGAMSAARLPSANSLSRLLGVAEVTVAVAALAAGWIPAIAAASALYLAFAVFTFSAVRKRMPLQSCGCFGREDTPPTTLHVVYNVVAVLALGALPVIGRGPIDWALPMFELVLYLGFAMVGVYASFLLMTRLPRLLAIARSS